LQKHQWKEGFILIARRIIRADLSQDLNNLYFLSNQYDDYSRKYRVIITNNGILQPFTAQKPIRLIMKAENESAPYYDDYLKSDEWEDGFPVVTFTASMLSKVGNIDFQFIIYEPGSPESVSTRQQHLKIKESLIDYDGIIASQEFNFLTDLIAQATTIPALIIDINTSIEEVTAKIAEVNTKLALYETQMQTYATEFAEMQTEQQAVINALHAYMESVENTAAASAKLSESWAIGHTGTRVGEDTNNSKYHSDQSKAEADRAKTEADKAAVYAEITIPSFVTDLITGHLTYSDDSSLIFNANHATGHLLYNPA
jgi:hypothetical protein